VSLGRGHSREVRRAVGVRRPGTGRVLRGFGTVWVRCGLSVTGWLIWRRHRGSPGKRIATAITHGLVSQLQVLFERAPGGDALGLEHAVIGAHGLLGGDPAVGDQPEHLDEGRVDVRRC
jgi:hypothetical protein